MLLTKTDVVKIGDEMFPTAANGRWGSSLAKAAGVSTATISNILNGAEISKKISDKIIAAYCEFGGSITDEEVVETVEPPFTKKEDIYTSEERAVAERIGKRFNVAEQLTYSMIDGKIRSMIISGAAGVGKSYTIEKILNESHADVDFISGTVSAGGMYSVLYKKRNGGIIVIDDADSAFGDEDSMNILKKSLDSSDTRVLSWKKKSNFVYDEDLLDEKGIEKAKNEGKIPNTFEFNGSVIFITNIDFAKEADKGNKMSEHFKALMSRSMYIDLTMNTAYDRIVRMKQIFLDGGMYQKENMSFEAAVEVMEFVEHHQNRFRDLSLRLMKHVCEAYHVGDSWKDVIEVTKMK